MHLQLKTNLPKAEVKIEKKDLLDKTKESWRCSKWWKRVKYLKLIKW